VQAARFVLPIRSLTALDQEQEQEQEPKASGGEAGSGGGLGPVMGSQPARFEKLSQSKNASACCGTFARVVAAPQ